MAEKVTRTITKEYWDCGRPECNHLTREAAERCEQRRPLRSGDQDEGVARRNERIISVLRARYNGETFRSAGRLIGVGPERARQIIVRAARRGHKHLTEGCSAVGLPDTATRPGAAELDAAIRLLEGDAARRPALSVRAVNALKAQELTTVGSIAEALYGERKELDKAPNVGKKTLAEIKEWMASNPTQSELDWILAP